MSSQALKDTFRRSLAFKREAINAEARTVELAFSSEAPVERYFGTEVLDHRSECVQMGRILGGAPLLLDHDTGQQIGVVESARIDGDKTGRAVVRFSRSAKGQEIFQDVQDGIRSLVSVGYRIHKLETEKRKDGSEVQRATLWEPLEISIVAIPADPSVGVGRSEQAGQITSPEEVPQSRKPMSAPAPKVEVPAAPNDALEKERSRVSEITKIADQYKCRDLALKSIADGDDVQTFQNRVLVEVCKAKPATPTDSHIGMSEREVNEFSIRKAIHDICNGGLKGLEKEASEAAAQKYGRNVSDLGFCVPGDVMTRTTMSAGTNSVGGYTVQTTVGPLIELLRNKMVMTAAGVQMLSGLQGNISLPKQSAAGTAYWLSETGSITGSNQTLAQIPLQPHRLGAFTDLSKQLIAQSTIDAEAFVRNDLATIISLALDKAIIEGSGSSNQPTGIINTSGVGSVTFGAAATWAKLVSFETAVATANADIGSMNYVSTAATRGALKTSPKIGSTYPVFLCENNQVNGYPLLVTNQVSSDKMLFGVFSQATLAMWGGIDILVDPYTQALAGTVRLVAQTYADVAVRQAGAFAVSTDSAAQ